MKDSQGYAQFEEKLLHLGIPQDISQWLFSQMVNRWKVPPAPEHPITIDDDDWYGFIVEGTVEVCRFRPTSAEVAEAVKGLELTQFVDFARVITYLCNHGPDIGNTVMYLCPSNYSKGTEELWKTLCQITWHGYHEYNDQFAIRCYLDRSLLKRILFPCSWVDQVGNFLGRKFFWMNTFGIERDLKRHGYKLEQINDVRECRASAGDILKLVKSPWHDRFTHFAIVADVNGGCIKDIEFKLNFNSPMRATLEGFETFFFRDPETKLEGIWRSNKQ